MSSRRRAFPLIPDDQPVIGQSTEMRLYDNKDLITNINGTYYDKDYSLVPSESPFIPKTADKTKDQPSSESAVKDQQQTYAELARETAKKDVRQKRQSYLNQELQRAKKSSEAIKTSASLGQASPLIEPFTKPQKASLVTSKKRLSKSQRSPKAVTLKKASELASFSDKLRQESYILVDLPKVYRKKDHQKETEPKKNSFDFLKRSQIYNYQKRQEKRERQIAQELNLTRFDHE